MRKNIFKTIVLSVLIAAVLALGMTSFAATVSTTTTYNAASGNVHVSTTVSGVEVDSMVAYMVTNNTTGSVNNASDVLYVYQKTADTGTLNFEYEIDKTKLSTLDTRVRFGSDKTLNIDPDANVNKETLTNKSYAAELGLLNITESVNNGEGGATITYFTDRACQNTASGTTGFGETVYAQVTPDSGYEIDSVTVDNNSENPDDGVYQVRQSISVTTKERQASVGITAVQPIRVTYNERGENPLTGYGYIIQKRDGVGTLEEVGIAYNGYSYPAILPSGDNDTLSVGLDTRSDREDYRICAVVLIFDGTGAESDGGNLNGDAPSNVLASMTPYYKVAGDDNYYDKNDIPIENVQSSAPSGFGAMSTPEPDLDMVGKPLPKKANIVIEKIEDSSDDNDADISEISEEPVVEEPEEIIENSSDDIEDISDIIDNNVNE